MNKKLYLLFLIFLLACSSAQKTEEKIHKPIENQGVEEVILSEAEMRFVGDWENVQEQNQLNFAKNKTCQVNLTDKKTSKSETIQGKWEVNGARIKITWEKDWLYSQNKQTTYEFRKTERQSILWYIYSAEEQKEFRKDGHFAFYKN